MTISRLFSDLEFVWRLREEGDATRIEVTAQLPEVEAHRLPLQQLLTRSLQRLTLLTVPPAERHPCDSDGASDSGSGDSGSDDSGSHAARPGRA